MTTNKRLFIVTMNPLAADVEAFSRYIIDSRDISRYWNHIPFVFCVESLLTARDLTVRFKPFLKHNYLIVPIDPFTMDGQLREEQWDWFYENIALDPQLSLPDSSDAS